MGMLINGTWSEEDQTIQAGAYVRAASPIRSSSALGERPGRFWLIASKSCPWSHRVVLLHAIKGLGDLVPVHFAHGPRVEGYAADGGKPWKVPGAAKTVRHLHQLYSVHDEIYSGRVTVPVLWDSVAQKIISNDSADILGLFDGLGNQRGRDFTVRPPALAGAIDEANEAVYQGLNNAVYRAGFAQTQGAYEAAVRVVFETLDRLEQRLKTSRYYFGAMLTETDLRLFPTLVRFDAVYHILFKCSVRRLVDYPNLWAYVRDLFGWAGVAETVDLEVIREASYVADTSDPHPIVALQPDLDWTSPHGRELLGAACLIARDGESFAVDAG
ncbi:MAG: glutathione S-transferase C-terminal domain-containing protein [Pseudomonadota bacterium]